MWIVMNDSYVSIVEDRTNEQNVVVRARVREDLENLFAVNASDIIETDNSDYRFRLFLDRKFVADIVRQRIETIDYDNFKNSVKEPWRKQAYTKIWQVMYEVQSKMYGIGSWWVNYRN
jgi:hypothetical protein